MVSIIQIDHQDFEIGANSTDFTYGSRLYQAQVTGLISLRLIIIRLIAGSSSALLAWRIVFILLEKRGITPAELTRLMNFRVPILPGKSSRASLLWSFWALVAILLLWPHGFAAPLASSSISWIPGTRVLQQSESTSVANVSSELAKWYILLYEDICMSMILDAAAKTANDPAYAFPPTRLPLRRYFKTDEMIPSGSKIDMPLPYFAVDLRWVDASSDDRSQQVRNPSRQDVNEGFAIRLGGAVNIIRGQPWDPRAATPNKPNTFTGKKFVAVFFSTLELGKSLPDGSRASNSTKCLKVSDDFGQLSNVGQYPMPLFVRDQMTAYDCFMFAEATITAGSIQAQECNVTTSAGSTGSYATCFVDRNDSAVEEHWLTELALDFTSEVLKYSRLEGYTRPDLSDDLNDYVSGILTLGYHAAWSALITGVGNSSEPVEFRAATPIIFASIDKTRLYIWLAMQATLTVSAVLVLLAQSVSRNKTIRDPTVAALMVDLTDVTHSGRANGLCNAVTLSKEDQKLPLLQWEGEADKTRSGKDRIDKSSCQKIIFADEAVRSLRRRHRFGEQLQGDEL